MVFLFTTNSISVCIDNVYSMDIYELCSDYCCSPSFVTGRPDWNFCQLYFQLRSPSTCTGYQAPTIGNEIVSSHMAPLYYHCENFLVTGLGDPHMTTIDNGRYTCHIQGLYIFAQTTPEANSTAYLNQQNNPGVTELIYPGDLFKIHVRSVVATPALFYIERTHGYGSIFSSYTVITTTISFTISNENGKFGRYLSLEANT